MSDLRPSHKLRKILGLTVSERDDAGLFCLIEAPELGRFWSDLSAERAAREHLARKGSQDNGSENAS